MSDFEIPNLYIPVAAALNPALEKAAAAADAWLEEFDLVPTDQARRHVERTRVDRLTAWLCPEAPVEALTLITQWNAWLFQLDDQFDDNPLLGYQPARWRGAFGPLFAVFDGDIANGRLARALADLWQRTSAVRSLAWQRRFLPHLLWYFDSYRTDMMHRQEGRIPGLQQYLSHRRGSFAFDAVLDLMEMVSGMDLPDHVHANPAFADMREAVIYANACINDLYSLRKELAHDYAFNAVIVIRHHHKCSLQEAVNRVAAMQAGYVQRILDLEQVLPARLAGAGDNVILDALRCVQDFHALTAGNLAWSTETARYADIESDPSYLADLFTA
jgi:epi-isozizaene synthase